MSSGPLRVASARVRRHALRLRAPLATASGAVRAREGLLLVLEGASGARGFGEAAPLPQAGTEALAAAERALRIAATRLSGATGTPAELLEAAERSAAPGPTARFALETALADLAAREAGCSLAAWLAAAEGRAPRAAVPVNALLVAEAPEALGREAAAAVRAGFGVLKLKLSRDAARDAARLDAVRGAVGTAVALRGDANGAWTEAEAAARLRGLARHGLALVEQPVAPGDAAALARARAVGVPVAADEGARTPTEVERLLEARAVDALVLKPAALGGADRALAAARRATEAGVPCAVTSLLEGAVGVAAALHAAAAAPGRLLAGGLATSGLLAEDLAAPPLVRSGRMAVSKPPGLGLSPRAPAPGTEPADERARAGGAGA